MEYKYLIELKSYLNIIMYLYINNVFFKLKLWLLNINSYDSEVDKYIFLLEYHKLYGLIIC